MIITLKSRRTLSSSLSRMKFDIEDLSDSRPEAPAEGGRSIRSPKYYEGRIKNDYEMKR